MFDERSAARAQAPEPEDLPEIADADIEPLAPEAPTAEATAADAAAAHEQYLDTQLHELTTSRNIELDDVRRMAVERNVSEYVTGVLASLATTDAVLRKRLEKKGVMQGGAIVLGDGLDYLTEAMKNDVLALHAQTPSGTDAGARPALEAALRDTVTGYVPVGAGAETLRASEPGLPPFHHYVRARIFEVADAPLREELAARNVIGRDGEWKWSHPELKRLLAEAEEQLASLKRDSQNFATLDSAALHERMKTYVRFRLTEHGGATSEREPPAAAFG